MAEMNWPAQRTRKAFIPWGVRRIVKGQISLSGAGLHPRVEASRPRIYSAPPRQCGTPGGAVGGGAKIRSLHREAAMPHLPSDLCLPLVLFVFFGLLNVA